MGVTGLWTVVQPCARPIELQTLNRKRLAIDASIWIYQFLKAVRDKEGNALRNSHVVGFFRRICKLLFFGIKPVFVFDGGAPALKRQTILGRKKRREGRREDAVRTAGRLLAVQMQRAGEEEMERRRQVRRGEDVDSLAMVEEEVVPRDEDLIYADEATMTAKERTAARKFTKKDAYHLPELDNGFEGMGQPNDPRIMSAEELEEYARQFNSGEDINMYDFSKIDFNGDFFLSLPAVDRYNILNAARLRSRLRMGLSKEQLDKMFPDRMAFSKFQIERVKERNELTQRLMNLTGMNGQDGTLGINGGGRIAGERGREYILVKNEGVEGGWALGVVSTDKEIGQRTKPIDVDALHQRSREIEAEEEEESDDDFEDVPVEGLNRLPKIKSDLTTNPTYEAFRAQEMADQRERLYSSRKTLESNAPTNTTSLFVEDIGADENDLPSFADNDDDDEDLRRAIAMSLQADTDKDDDIHGEKFRHTASSSRLNYEGNVLGDEDEHLNRAIALSLRKNHIQDSDDEDFEDIQMPTYQQEAVEEYRPLPNASGSVVAHIINNRANASVPKRRSESNSSDSDIGLESVLAAARRKKAPATKPHHQAPVPLNLPNPFSGPLPFEKLDFKSSIFKKKDATPQKASDTKSEDEDDEHQAGGFEVESKAEPSKPLPPWLIDNGDIRSQVQQQQRHDLELNAEDRAVALEEQRIFERDYGVIQVESSDSGSDVEILDSLPPRKSNGKIVKTVEAVEAQPSRSDISQENGSARSPALPSDIPKDDGEIEKEEAMEWSESEYGDTANSTADAVQGATSRQTSESPEFEDVGMPQVIPIEESSVAQPRENSLPPVFEDVNIPGADLERESDVPVEPNSSRIGNQLDQQQMDQADDVEFDDLSDPDDEELLAQLAVEAEEHARFASTLNNKSEQENKAAYEQELKALRNQQKKDRRDADEVSHIMITECQALLRYFGLPYITAPMEAEAQCAELVHLGLVDGVVTDDSDIFLFGGTKVYKNMFNSNKFVECYLASDLEKELSLSREQLIALAQLLGSDYTEGLPGIGPVTAVEILSEFPSSSGLNEFKEWWTSVQHSTRLKEPEKSTFRRKFRKSQATKLFLPAGFPSPAVTEAYMKPEVDSSPEPFQWGVPDLDGLRNFLMSTIGWSQERTDEVLVPVIRDMNRREMEGTQSNITRYFEGGVGTGTRRMLNRNNGGSTRMKEAVSKLKAKKSGSGYLNGTFADEAIDWAKKNDLSFTEKEQEKSKKRSRVSKRAVGNVNEEVDSDIEAGSEDSVDEEEHMDQDPSTRKGKGQAKRRRAKV
ncbi:DNA excision repair protein-like protein [Xylogone sp. PMI_703]|nr:DNA excision repair protein-like protein [Xylogone sp. PMI_703]